MALSYRKGMIMLPKKQATVNVSQVDLLAAMEREPKLTNFGLGIFDDPRLTEAGRAAEFEKNRRALAENFDEFTTCVRWLTGRVRHVCSDSYALKHAVEHDLPGVYVSNGSFIAAVIHMGIPYVKYRDYPNIHIQWRKWARMQRERQL